jgi:hypothetical protein
MDRGSAFNSRRTPSHCQRSNEQEKYGDSVSLTSAKTEDLKVVVATGNRLASAVMLDGQTHAAKGHRIGMRIRSHGAECRKRVRSGCTEALEVGDGLLKS